MELQPSQTQQYTASVIGTGNFDKSVNWFVNDIPGGNAEVGTISLGLFTSPAQEPSAEVIIKAVAAGDATKWGTARALIRRVRGGPKTIWPEKNITNTTDDEGDSSETPPGLALVDDGAGGAYVVWEHRFPIGIRVQHLDVNGQPTWPWPGVPVTSPWTGWQASPRAVSDNAGGLIVAWVDGRAGWCGPSLMAECDVYGQRIDADGELLWGATGKPISDAPTNQGIENLRVLSDGSGGAFVAFSDNRDAQGTSLYMQRVNGAGDPVWQVNGVRIAEDLGAGGNGLVEQVTAVPDDLGGVLVAWYFTNYVPGTVTVRAQRISPSGQPTWNPGGITVPGVSQSEPSGSGAQTLDAISDGAGGIIIVASWLPPAAMNPAILAQRIDALGNVRWPTTGARVSTSSHNVQMNPRALADGAGGAFVSWQDCPGWNSCDIAVQRLDGSGNSRWGVQQLEIAQLPNQQLAPFMERNNVGGVVVMWTDCRDYSDSDANNCHANSDIYAQNLDGNGNALWAINGYPLTKAPGNQGEQYYLYTPLPAASYLRLESGDIVIGWPDGRDNTCFSSNASSACQVFVERIAF